MILHIERAVHGTMISCIQVEIDLEVPALPPIFHQYDYCGNSSSLSFRREVIIGGERLKLMAEVAWNADAGRFEGKVADPPGAGLPGFGPEPKIPEHFAYCRWKLLQRIPPLLDAGWRVCLSSEQYFSKLHVEFDGKPEPPEFGLLPTEFNLKGSKA